MRKFYIFTVFFTTVLLAASFIPLRALALPDPELGAEVALLVETESGSILYEKNKDIRVAPGSIAKVMTLLLAIEAVNKGQADLQDNTAASNTFLFGLGENDTVLGIRPGEVLGYPDLLYAAYLAQAADACNILAEKLSGSIEAFAAKMNEKARAIGCENTHFTNPGGTDALDQYTTAWDQYLIFKEAAGHELFQEIAGTKSYIIDATALSPERNLINPNRMLDMGSKHHYRNCVAGLPGKDETSFITYAADSSLSLVSVVYRKAAADTPEFYDETIRLLDWGFLGFEWRDILNKNDVAANEEIALAEGTDIVALRPYDSLNILVPRDVTAASITKEIIIFGKPDGRTLSAPVRAGDILGEIKVYIDGMPGGRVKLVAAHDVALDRAAFIKGQILHMLSNFWVIMAAIVFVILIAGYAWLVICDRRRRQEEKRKIETVKNKIIEDRQRQKIER